VDFTREPIVETIITPKDGWMLVIRSSKGVGQEEYFVDAVEVITFGSMSFFRSQERPKSFMVPVSDYEVVEVRETRMVLKNITLDRSIKIGNGKEFSPRVAKEQAPERQERPVVQVASPPDSAESPQPLQAREEPASDVRLEKKRDRKRNFRRKRAREDVAFRDEEGERTQDPSLDGSTEVPVPVFTAAISSLLPPPQTLISETIARYKDNALFKGAFFSKEEVLQTDESLTASKHDEVDQHHIEDEVVVADDLGMPEMPQISLDYPVYGADSHMFGGSCSMPLSACSVEACDALKDHSEIKEDSHFDKDAASCNLNQCSENINAESESIEAVNNVHTKQEKADPEIACAAPALPEELLEVAADEVHIAEDAARKDLEARAEEATIADDLVPDDTDKKITEQLAEKIHQHDEDHNGPSVSP